MNFLKIRTSEIRVGVVGMYASGKTVFMTSLINHLKDHDPDRFRLGKGSVTLRKFQELVTDGGWHRFDYLAHRDKIVHARWPVKTSDCSQYICAFERSDWRISSAKLKLYDLPGERIADAVMVAKDYAGWSDHVLRLLESDNGYRECAGEYLKLVQGPTPLSEEKILEAYRLTLARLILRYKPYITPSAFLLDVHGRMPKPSSAAEAIALERHSGLGKDNEFAPLPAWLRASAPDLAKLFELRYTAYKYQLVLPIFQVFKSCHALVVLVDVLTLLANGYGMYDDNRTMLVDLLEVMAPGETPLGRMIRGASSLLLPHSWRPGWITKIAFVAPKLDQAHPLDQDKMVQLIRRMLEKPARDRDGLAPLFSNCGAAISTKKFPAEGGKRILVGALLRDETGKRIPPGEMKKFEVSELPDDWPRLWQPGDYVFPEVYPIVPPRKDCPPDQVNLDRILDFVMS